MCDFKLGIRTVGYKDERLADYDFKTEYIILISKGGVSYWWCCNFESCYNKFDDTILNVAKPKIFLDVKDQIFKITM